MRKYIAALAILAAYAAVAVPSDPTYNQVERLIHTVRAMNGEDAGSTIPTSKVYSRPTYSQIERLIAAVGNGTNATATVSGARYLSIWDCSTGRPLDNMASTVYHKGDVYIVGNATTNTGEVVQYYRHVIRLDGHKNGSLPEDSTYVTNVVFTLVNKEASAYTTVDGVARGLIAAGYSNKLAGLREVSGDWFVSAGVRQSIFSIIGGDYDGTVCIIYFQDSGLGANFELKDADHLYDTVTECEPLAQYSHSIVAEGYTSGAYDAIPNSYSALTLEFTNEVASAFVTTNDMFELAYYIARAGSSYPDRSLPVSAGTVWTNNHTASASVASVWGEVSREFPSYLKLIPNGVPLSQITEDSPFAATNATIVSDTVVDVTDVVHGGGRLGNMRPDGYAYSSNSVSRVAETNSVSVGDVYWYDGEKWVLMSYCAVVGQFTDAWTNAVTAVVVDRTGIHQGEISLKQQYNKGVWGEYRENTNDCSVEVGVNARTVEYGSSNQSIAIGRDALSSGSATVAVGPNAFAQNAQSVAVGWRANAVGNHTVSIGSAKKSGEDYYEGGEVNPDSDLNLAEGDYSIAVGYNVKAKGASSTAFGNEAKATASASTAVGKGASAAAENSTAIGNGATASAVGSVQLGTGANTVAHTLKFEDVTIVKDGQVVGSVPSPESVDPTEETEEGEEELSVTVKPGSTTTILPSKTTGPGVECGVSCTGLRNYTVYLPNEAQLREGLPGTIYTELPAGVSASFIGSQNFTKLPVKMVVEQPYSKLTVVTVTQLDDGFDWSPVVTNCDIVYKMSVAAGENKFCVTNTYADGNVKSIMGTGLHCGTEYRLAYPNSAGSAMITNDLMTVSAGSSYMSGTFYGFVSSIELKITDSSKVPQMVDTAGGKTVIHAKILYTTLYGSAVFDTDIEVVTE